MNSLIYSTTMRTLAKSSKPGTTIPANIPMKRTTQPMKCKTKVSHPKDIANIIESEDTENNIVNGRYRSKSKQIEQSTVNRQTADYILHGCNACYDHRPNKDNKDSQNRG